MVTLCFVVQTAPQRMYKGTETMCTRGDHRDHESGASRSVFIAPHV